MATCSALSADGLTVATGSVNGVVTIASTDDRTTLKELNAHGTFLTAVAIANDRRTLVTSAWDATVLVWDLSGDTERFKALEGVTAITMAVAITSDGRLVATGSDDGFVRVWDSRTGRILLRIKEPSREIKLVFSPDFRSLAIFIGNIWLSMLDVRTGQELDAIANRDLFPFSSPRFSKDGNSLQATNLNCKPFTWHVTPKWKLQVWSVLSTGKWDEEMARELSHFF